MQPSIGTMVSEATNAFLNSYWFVAGAVCGVLIYFIRQKDKR